MSQPISGALRIRIMLRSSPGTYFEFESFLFIIQNPQVSEIFFQFIGEISARAIKMLNRHRNIFHILEKGKFQKISHEKLMSEKNVSQPKRDCYFMLNSGERWKKLVKTRIDLHEQFRQPPSLLDSFNDKSDE